MKKRNISIPSFNKAEPRGLWSLTKAVTFFLLLSCIVVPLSCEGQKAAEPPSKTKANSLPTITLVTILPERPTRENDLSLVIQSQDSDGDLVNYRYQWIKNDIEIAGESGNVLKAGSFRKGDMFQVRVIPSDGKGDGKPFLSNPVKILNAAPIVSEAWIEPQMPTIQNDLKVHEKSTDADGDSIFFPINGKKMEPPLWARGRTCWSEFDSRREIRFPSPSFLMTGRSWGHQKIRTRQDLQQSTHHCILPPYLYRRDEISLSSQGQ